MTFKRTWWKYFIASLVCLPIAIVGTILNMIGGRAFITEFGTFSFVFFLTSILFWFPLTVGVSVLAGILKKSWKVIILNLIFACVLLILTFLVPLIIDGFLVARCELSWKEYRKEISIKNVVLEPIGKDPRGIQSPAILSFDIDSNLQNQILVDFTMEVTGPKKSSVLMANIGKEFQNFEQVIKPGKNEFNVRLEALKFWDKEVFDKNQERFLRIEVDSNYKNTGCYQEGGTEILRYDEPAKI